MASIVNGSSPSPSKKYENKLSKRAFRRNPTPNSNSSRVSLEDQLDFERDGELVPLPSEYLDPNPDLMFKSEIIQRQPLANRRKPLRMDAQDGPWSVSAAESLSDPHTYSLYVKTPTHHLTLTRTTAEVNSLHSKLRDAFTSLSLPPLPFDSSTLVLGKRRSSFLNTLSRLASPGPKPRLPPSSMAPLIVPRDNGDDPFNASPQSLTTQLAAYLTTLSNDQIVRASKPWKRFVRVRTDDLESVRVERAIKRVRSDLAMHAATGTPHPTDPITGSAIPSPSLQGEATTGDDTPGVGSSAAASDGEPKDSQQQTLPEDPQVVTAIQLSEPSPITPADKSLLDDENTAVAAGLATATPIASPSPSPIIPQAPTLSHVEQHDVVATDPLSPSTLAASSKPSVHLTHRIMRSASADPDKATRLSRAFKSAELDNNDDSSRKSISKRSSGNDQLRKSARKVVIDDFEMMRVLGKGCAGKVLLVRHKATSDMYALKAITKRHVLAHQELQHTLTEQAVLKRMAREGADPFVVKLWWSFHDRENLFLVMDFHPGGDLATQLARWGRLGRDRARFYAAEIVEGVEGLHAAGVIYRDLKPENILIGVDGHIVLTDFGLSKEFPRPSDVALVAPTAPATPSGSRSEYYSAADANTVVSPYWMKGANGSASSWHTTHANDTTATFCGTAEYLAPEVIQGLHYSYEVDWWSFGTMLFEMLTGITPFWANNHSDMYVRVLQDELQFPEDKSLDQDTRSLIRGLLQRNPALRIKEPRIKKHPYFSMIDWGHVYHKRYIPPYIPPIEADNPSDTQNFDDAFLDMDPTLDSDQLESQTTDSEQRTDDDGTEGEESVRTPAQSRSPSVHPTDNDAVDVFDGYSFKGRHSVLIDGEPPDNEEDPVVEEEEGEAEPSTILSAEVHGIREEEEDESAEAKTPEAKPHALPQVAEEHEGSMQDEMPISEEANSVEPQAEPQAEIDRPTSPTSTIEEAKLETPQVSVVEQPEVAVADLVHHSGTIRAHRSRREKSGVAALDRYLSEGNDADTEPLTKDEDEDWDLVEADVGEDRNGAKGTTLFARGVVDRYRLAVFRKSSSSRPKRIRRHFSGNSTDGEAAELDNTTTSPSPSEKVRRGRNPGLSFRAPKTFLRTKSPPATVSASTSTTSRASLVKSSATISASTSTSTATASASSLRSKPSTVSVDATISVDPSSASTQLSEFGTTPTADTRTTSSGDDQSGSKIQKMKKNYKEGAEKVFSLFGSPRA